MGLTNFSTWLEADQALIAKLGYDPDTGEIFDKSKVKMQKHQPAGPSISPQEVWQQATKAIARWVDGNPGKTFEQAKKDSIVVTFMNRHSNTDRLWSYLQAMIDNRAKYAAAVQKTSPVIK